MDINKNIFSPMYESCKGTYATLLVIGGSELYTGAPYFTAKAALISGFDLCYIMCEKEAVLPLKTLLPDAVVTHIQNISWILDKVDICVIGPGLGRPSEETIKIINKIYMHLKQREIYIIFDGDGIKLYSENEPLQKYESVIVTPNHNEYKRLKTVKPSFMIQKGPEDKITCNNKITLVDDMSSTKRCGGQGDILCGVLAYIVLKYSDVGSSMIAACKVLRRASYIAFEKKGRGTMPNDIIAELVDSFDYFVTVNRT